MRTLALSLSLSLGVATSLLSAQQSPAIVERTNIDDTISGVVEMGHVFKTISGNYYEVVEPIIEVVVEVMPKVTVLRSGTAYGLIIEGFDEPVTCRKLAGVIESRLDGESEGFEGRTVLVLQNGQVWRQTDGYYHYHYRYAPKVLIYSSNGGSKMQLEGIDRSVRVERLR